MKLRTELANHTHSSVHLTLKDDGTIKLDTADSGPTVEAAWGHDDYEYSTVVPSAAVPELCFLLLKEKFAGDLGAVSGLRTWCEAHGIAHEFESWP